MSYQPPANCGGCHTKIFAQWSGSMHARAYSNPIFQAALRKANEDGQTNPNHRAAARTCLACHSPITFLKLAERLRPAEAEDGALTGVGCDFCHSVRGYRGAAPGSANYIAWPSQAKRGPFVFNSFHSEYSQLHTKAEFCAICHDGTTPAGAPFRTTYSEWKAGPYPALGIQCQDCHMNNRGFLTDGEPTYESGKAAVIDAEIPHREKIYSHRFPGAYSSVQTEGALTLEIKAAPSTLEPGRKVVIDVLVTNAKAGHKVPTGSTEVRLMWLEVTAGPTGTEQRLAASPADAGFTWDVAALGPEDAQNLGTDVPPGSRVYRAILLDFDGKQAFTVHEVERLVFDNRLRPKETRRERYTFVVPPEFPPGKSLEIKARVLYRLYSSAFARRLEVPDRPPVEISSARFTLESAPGGARPQSPGG